MKKAIVALLLIFSLLTTIVATSYAVQHVSGYYTSRGTYVQPYVRSDANNTVRDNFSYYGNTNPYTGATGTNYYHNSPSSEYYMPSSGNYYESSGNNYYDSSSSDSYQNSYDSYSDE